MQKKSVFTPLLTLLIACLLAGCQAPAVAPAAPASLAGQILPYSFRSRGFDGTHLWEVLREESKTFLLKQALPGLALTRLTVSEALPLHRSLAWGRDRLWMLDYADQLYQIDPATGKVLGKQKLSELPEANASEQIAFSGDELWLLMRAYVSSANKLEPARFVRLDPETGKLLETRIVPGGVDPQPRPSIGFSDFIHQNLSADAKAFYVLRSALYEPHHNLLYRIDKKTLEVTHTELKRVFTGVPTLFFWQGRPYGIELLDTANCGEYCRGKLESF